MKPTGLAVGEEQVDTKQIPFSHLAVRGRGEGGCRERFEHSFIPAMNTKEESLRERGE